MSTGKRLAKRSIIGTRVCAPGDDGKYYSGVISAVNTPSQPGKHDSPNGALSITPQTRYQVRFDPPPNGSKVPADKREYLDRDLIGPGFSSVYGAKLVAGQKVFLTHNGREVQGSVIEHREHLDEVDVVISPNKQEGANILTRRIDGVRLMESRKSARLADSDTDFARLADVGSDRKRTATQATIDRPDNSNSPCHINNRSPNNNQQWNKPRRRTQSEMSAGTDNSENNIGELATRTYKNSSSPSSNDSSITAYYHHHHDHHDYSSHHPYAMHHNLEPKSTTTTTTTTTTSPRVNDNNMQNILLSADHDATTAAMALVSLSSPSKQTKFDDVCYTQCFMAGMEESSSSGNSNASGSESDNSWRSDTPSLRSSAEDYYASHHHHQQSSSAPSSPKDEGIVPDLLYPSHRYNKKRRFINVTATVNDEDDEEDEQVVVSRSSPKYVTSKPQQQQQQQAPTKGPRREEFVQTTKAKRGRPPTYRRRSPTPKRLPHHEDASDGDGEDSIDLSNVGALSNGYSDNGKKYICTWSPGNGEPACGVTGNFNFVANHFIQRHNDKDEDMDFYVLEEGEYKVRTVESKPTECGLPTKSHWDMVKPMSADPEYQMQIHRSQMAAHAAAESLVNAGRGEIIYLENGSLSPRDDLSLRQNMSPPRPANKPIKARASQQQRQFIINNNNNNNNNNSNHHNNNNNHMTKVSLVHINLGKMPQTTRRGRSDVKKCRKVYGMSHKELWCTQCKWKKACQRFHMPQPGGPTAAAASAATEIAIQEQLNSR